MLTGWHLLQSRLPLWLPCLLVVLLLLLLLYLLLLLLVLLLLWERSWQADGLYLCWLWRISV
jgi:hypothetical protein